MAVVKIGQVKQTLSKAMQYICNPDKTRDMELVSTNLPSVGKDPTAFAQYFLEEQHRIETGRAPTKTTLVRAHHIIQSFDPGDNITPERAHELGVELMERITGGMQHYVIATHTDRDHIHNHIMLSPVNFETLKRVKVPRTYLKRLRTISDELCLENGLKVIREKKVKSYGKTRPDLYTQLKGESVKESIRLRIDQTAGRVESFDQFKRVLRSTGVFTHVRGKYLTFEDAQTGMRFRDAKLGEAYDEMSLMVKIGQESLECISFNRGMIARQDSRTVSVWVPGTRRGKRLVIPRQRLVVDGQTIRAWLPRDSEQVLSDSRGRFMQQVPTEGLYEYFTPPSLNIDKLIRNSFPQIYTANPAQRKRLMAQAIKVEEVNNVVREINTVREYLLEGGMSSRQAVATLGAKIRERQDDLQALIVASCEEGLNPEQVESLDKQIRGSEKEISDLARQVKALTGREQRLTQQEGQRRQGKHHGR
ncbi:MAG: relaxase/mobilization nuclease domain-containing protein [Bifidobacterium sp.]|uniref:Mobilization protein n=2 Tax=Bifidobacterium TaxID=1678 RepID=A0A261GBJ6_9BIFI|nr:relaxase/mobilization nuclease domain-containing protein [Bifidobacterium aquikefiri]OZG68807.1 mobilization protein [Bifidobacterium aquikefiri]